MSQGQTMQGHHNYIGEGKVTEGMIKSEKSFFACLIKFGIEEPLVNYIVYTCLPKGHAEHLSKNAAAKQFYPKLSMGAVTFRAEKAMTAFFTQLLHGQEAERLAQEKTEQEKNKPPRKSYNHVSAAEKAHTMAEREVGIMFRVQNSLNMRGAISKDLQEKFKTFKDKMFPDVLKRHQKMLGITVTPAQNSTKQGQKQKQGQHTRELVAIP